MFPRCANGGEDIRPLTEYFLEHYATSMGKPHPPVRTEFFERLVDNSFPGNIRELEGIVSDALVRHASGPLTADLLHSGPGNEKSPDPLLYREPRPKRVASAADAVGTRRRLIGEAMARSRGNQAVASRMLGISRTALNKRRRK